MINELIDLSIYFLLHLVGDSEFLWHLTEYLLVLPLDNQIIFYYKVHLITLEFAYSVVYCHRCTL